MPLYEYECLRCGERFEQIRRFSDEPLKQHPECGGEVRKLLSAPAIQFKGSGWYVTDYAQKGKSDGKAEEAPKKSDDKAGKETVAKGSADGASKTQSSAASKPSGTDSSKK